MKGGSEIQFVADWFNINPNVTLAISPPLLNYLNAPDVVHKMKPGLQYTGQILTQ